MRVHGLCRSILRQYDEMTTTCADTHRRKRVCCLENQESIFTIHACSTEQGWCFIRTHVPRRGTVTVKSRGRDRRTKTTHTRPLTGVSSKLPSALMRFSPQEIYHRSQINDTILYMESRLRLYSTQSNKTAEKKEKCKV